MPLHYTVRARQVVPNVSVSRAKQAQVFFDSSPDQCEDLLNPAELLLTAFAACMLKNIERFSRILRFNYSAAEVQVDGTREDRPPRLTTLTYTLHLWTDEPPRVVEMLHRNLQQFGTIYNTLAASLEVTGQIEAHAAALAKPEEPATPEEQTTP